MDRQLKRFDLPEPKSKETMYPFQRELLAQMLMRQKVYIFYPPHFGRADALRMMSHFVNEFKRGENS